MHTPASTAHPATAPAKRFPTTTRHVATLVFCAGFDSAADAIMKSGIGLVAASARVIQTVGYQHMPVEAFKRVNGRVFVEQTD